jgi:hypothetical protein
MVTYDYDILILPDVDEIKVNDSPARSNIKLIPTGIQV